MTHDKHPQTGRGFAASYDHVQNPLDYIAEDHMREREICALIDHMAPSAALTETEAQQVLDFLQRQLPQHLADEEIDLFPLMLKRCAPEDEIDKVIDKLHADHGHAVTDATVIVGILQSHLATQHPLSEHECDLISDFSHHARRHLIIENAIILPIARARLTAGDMAIMAQHMRDRRDAPQVH